MKEKDIQTIFGKRNTVNGVFELKLCKGTSLPFKSLAEHQEQALLDCSIGNGYYFKITDQPIFAGKATRFHTKKPFDCFRLYRVNAYVVLCFYVPRKKKNIYYIDIRDWVNMRMESKRKSVTEAMAEDYATFKDSYMKVK